MPSQINHNNEIAELLLSGGIALLPTDTVYGLAVSPRFLNSVEKVCKLKMRPKSKNLPIMVHSQSVLKELGVEILPQAQKLLNSSLCPGAITLILGFTKKPLVSWLFGRDEIAIRIPNDQRLLEILNLTGPLLVTSANQSGKQTPESVYEILKQLSDQPDMVIDGGKLKTTSSTIINCRNDKLIVEREGKISTSTINEVLGI